MDFESLKVLSGTIRLRPEYDGRPLLAQRKPLDGLTCRLQCFWLMDDSDQYPGEWALGIPHDQQDDRTHPLRAHRTGWIASGDFHVNPPATKPGGA